MCAHVPEYAKHLCMFVDLAMNIYVYADGMMHVPMPLRSCMQMCVWASA